MNPLQTVLTIAVAVCALGGVLGALYAVAKSSSRDKTVELQAKQITALEQRLKLVETERSECTESLAKLQAAYEILVSAIRAPAQSVRRSPAARSRHDD